MKIRFQVIIFANAALACAAGIFGKFYKEETMPFSLTVVIIYGQNVKPEDVAFLESAAASFSIRA